jgi:phenylpyruvate tautomerase PptA (4-oxalocrotonate tautomerase family)
MGLDRAPLCPRSPKQIRPIRWRWRVQEPGPRITGHCPPGPRGWGSEKLDPSSKGEHPMPLVRIDLRKGKQTAYREAISRIMHESLVSVGVPKDDRFQVISEHDAENFVFDPNYLDIRRTEDLVIIQITWNEGRTVEQKKALYKAIADKLSLRREDVFVSVVEVKRKNWSFGNGVAQYAT